jgi:hypothetical protein
MIGSVDLRKDKLISIEEGDRVQRNFGGIYIFAGVVTGIVFVSANEVLWESHVRERHVKIVERFIDLPESVGLRSCS